MMYLLLVTCVFAINYHVAATAEQDPSNRTLLFVKFEDVLKLECNKYKYMYRRYNVLEAHLIRNGQDLCTRNSTWCSQDGNTEILLRKVIQNGTYTCQFTKYDGTKPMNISVTEVFVVPRKNETTYKAIGSNATIYCLVETPNLDLRLVRDGKESCNDEALKRWCLQRIGYVGSSRYFDVLNLQANHTYTCEAYNGTKRLATVEVHHILVGPKPKIHEITFSPADPVQKGTQVVATARFYYPLCEPINRWDVGLPVYGFSSWTAKSLRDELSVLSENEYESRASLGPIHASTEFWLQVRNDYGYDLKYITVRVGVKYGELCNSTVVCATENTECNIQKGQCSCTQGYVWDSSSCSKTSSASKSVIPTTDVDEEYLFANSIAARLRTFSKKKKAMAVTDIQKVLFKREMKMDD